MMRITGDIRAQIKWVSYLNQHLQKKHEFCAFDLGLIHTFPLHNVVHVKVKIQVVLLMPCILAVLLGRRWVTNKHVCLL